MWFSEDPPPEKGRSYRSWSEAMQTFWSHPGSISEGTLPWPSALLVRAWEGWAFIPQSPNRRVTVSYGPFTAHSNLYGPIVTLHFLDRLSSGPITMANLSLRRNIIEIYGVIKWDLCDLNPLYASAVDVLVKMIKQCLEGCYSTHVETCFCCSCQMWYSY